MPQPKSILEGGTHRLPTACLVLLLVAAGIAAAQQQDAQQQQAVQQGAEIFKAGCSECHGENAEGNGPDHSAFIPPPANLTLTRDTPDMAFAIVKKGVPGTQMPPHPKIDRPTFDKIDQFVMSRPRSTAREWAFPWTLENAGTNQKAYAEFGEKTYTTACSGCHGKDGKGDGIFAQNRLVWPKPANFHARNSQPGRLYYIVTHGRPGTDMPPQYGKLPEMARWAAAIYVHNLFNKDSSAVIPSPKQAQPPTVSNSVAPSDQAAIAAARDNYNLYCVGCHGGHAQGTYLAPALNDRQWYFGGGEDTPVWVVLEQGVPGKLMVSFKAISEQDRWGVIALLRSWGGWPDPLASGTDQDDEDQQAAQQKEKPATAEGKQ